ncbi:hypothetical protein Cenrod_1613 [Candidatus Symbiobacter mobilis CR]|uniref:Uncharacterized protein n=1 Tax=Candidatus Symbiobacter mobilis CR TaxID=946483 RepID=U5NBS6_9BURK|nr:hypothetical protein Cenrod_1613 [Candidatus Symbiobacter mobilis CR]
MALNTTHPPDELQGPHVLAAVDDYLAVLDPPFLLEQ